MKAQLWIGLVLLLGGCAHGHGARGAHGAGELPAGISVTGFGEAAAPPTLARINVGVESRAVDAQGAISDVNQRIQRVIDAVVQAGVARADLQTSNLSLSFEQTSPHEPPPPIPMSSGPAPAVAPAKPGERGYEPPPAGPPGPLPRSLPSGFYRASNTLLVTIRELSKMGAILGAATGSGADQMYGIEFRVEDQKPLEATAREKAVTDAKERATRLATLSGVKLGKPRTIVETPNRSFEPQYGYEFKAAAASNVPVEQGTVNVRMSVQVVYEID